MHPWTTAIQRLLLAQADPALAQPMSQYMRNQFPFLGIKTPERKALFRSYFTSNHPSVSHLDRILHELWTLPEREYQYLAIDLLDKFSSKLPPDFTSTLQDLITTKSWWDTVDSISRTVGVQFQRYPESREEWLPQWRQADNLWLRRTAIIFQLNYKEKTDFPLLCEIVKENLGSKEFFINKAIGWALRQYARQDPAAVKRFSDKHALDKLSRKEALKHLK